MAVIDERVVEMKFDNRNFEKNVEVSLQTLAKLKDSLNLESATKSIKKVEDEMNNVSANSTKMSAALDKVSSAFSAMGAVGFTVMQRMTNQVIDLGKNITYKLIQPIKDGTKTYEAQIKAVQVTMNALNKTGLKGEKYVRGYLDNLNKYSDETIYTFQDMTTSLSKFVSAGVKIDHATEAIKGLGNVAALSGASTQEFSRAIYNVSQALGMGKMMTRDWMSIENANMATKEFKEQLIDTAKQVGYLDKDGRFTALGLSKVNSQLSKSAKDTTVTYKNLRDSLRYGWLDNNVLIGTLAKYSDETTKLGKKGKAAATEVKTLSQLLDTLGDALATKWSRIYTNVIGNFHEAKEFWTWVSNGLEKLLGGPLDKVAEATSKWKGFGGRDNLINAFKNGLIGLQTIFKSIQIGWQSIFPPKDLSTVLYQITKRIFEFNTAATNYILKIAPNIARTTRGISSVIKIVLNTVKGIGQVLRPVGQLLLALVADFLQVTGSVGDFFYEINNGLSGMEIFHNTLKALGDVIAAICRFVASVGEKVAKILSTIFQLITGIITIQVSEPTPFEVFLDNLAAKLDELTKNNIFFQFLDKVASGIKAFGQAIAPIGVAIKKSLTNSIGSLSNAIGNMDLFNGDILKFINLILTGKLITSISNTVSAISNSVKGIKNIVKQFGSILKNAGMAISAFQKLVNAQAMLQEAKAIFVLASAMLILSSLDPKGLAVGLIGLAGVMIIFSKGLKSTIDTLGIAAKATSTVKSKFLKGLNDLFGLGKIGKMFDAASFDMMSTAMLGFAGSIYILASALTKMAKADPMNLLISLFVLQRIMASFKKFVISFNAIIKKLKPSVKDMLGMSIVAIAFAEAIKIIAKAVVLLSGMTFADAIVGLGSFIVLMASLEIVLKKLSKIGKLGGKNLLRVGPVMLALAVAVGTMAVAIRIMSTSNWTQFITGTSSFIVVIAAMEICLKKLSSMTKLNSINLDRLIPVFLAFGLTVGALAISLKMMSTTDWTRFVTGTSSFIVVMASMEICLKKLSKMSKLGSINLDRLIPVLLSFGIMVLALAASLKKMQTGDETKWISGITSFITVMAAMEICLNKLSSMTKQGSINLDRLIPVFLSFGITVAILAQSMKTLQTSNPMKWVTGLTGYMVAVFILEQAMTSMSAIAKSGSTGDLMKVGVSMMMLGATIGMFAQSMAVIGNLGTEEWVQSITSMVAISILLNTLITNFSKIGKEGTTSLLKVSASMIIFAAALAVISGSLIALSLVPFPQLIVATSVIIALVGGFALLADVGGPLIPVMQALVPVLLQLAGVIVVFAAGATLFSFAITLFSTAVLILSAAFAANGASIDLAILALTGALASLVIMAYALAPIVPVLISFASVILKFAVSAIVFSAAAFIFAAALTMITVAIAVLTYTIQNGGASAVTAIIALAAVMVALAVVANLILPLVPGLAAVTAVLQALGKTILIFAVAVGILVAAFALMALAGDKLIKGMDKIIKYAPKIADKFIQMIIAVIKGMADAIDKHGDELIAAIGKLFYEIGEFILKGIGSIGKFIANGVKDIFGNIKKVLTGEAKKTAKSAGKAAGKAAVEGTKEGAKDAKATGKKAGKDTADGVKSTAGDNKKAGQSVGAAVVDGLQSKAGFDSKSGKSVKAKKEADKVKEGFSSGVTSAIPGLKDMGVNTADAYGISMNNRLDDWIGSAQNKLANFKAASSTVTYSKKAKRDKKGYQTKGLDIGTYNGQKWYFNNGVPLYPVGKTKKKKSSSESIMSDLMSTPTGGGIPASTGSTGSTGTSKKKGSSSKKRKGTVKEGPWGNKPGYKPEKNGIWSYAKYFKGFNRYQEDSKNQTALFAKYDKKLDKFLDYQKKIAKNTDPKPWTKSTYIKKVAGVATGYANPKAKKLRSDLKMHQGFRDKYLSDAAYYSDKADHAKNKKSKKRYNTLSQKKLRYAEYEEMIIGKDKKKLKNYGSKTDYTKVGKIIGDVWTDSYGNTAEYKQTKKRVKSLNKDANKQKDRLKFIKSERNKAIKDEKKYKNATTSSGKARYEAAKKYYDYLKGEEKTATDKLKKDGEEISKLSKTIKNGPHEAFNKMYKDVSKNLKDALKMTTLFAKDSGENIWEHFTYSGTKKEFESGKQAWRYAGYGKTQNEYYANLKADRDYILAREDLSDELKDYVSRNWRELGNEMHAFRYGTLADQKQIDLNYQQKVKNDHDSAYSNYKEKIAEAKKWAGNIQKLAQLGFNGKALSQLISNGFSEDNVALTETMVDLLQNGTEQEKKDVLDLGTSIAGSEKDSIIASIMTSETYAKASPERQKELREALGWTEENNEIMQQEAMTDGENAAKAYNQGITNYRANKGDKSVLGDEWYGYIGSLIPDGKTLSKGVIDAINVINNGIDNWVTGGETYAGKKSSNMVKTICKVMNDVADKDAPEVGKMLIQGLINGTLDHQHRAELNAAAEETGRIAPDTVKKILGINSPSKVFYEIGQYILEGLTNGLSDTSSVEKAAQKSAKAVLKGFGAINQIGTENITPTVAPVVDQDSFNAVTTQLGGFITDTSAQLANQIQYQLDTNKAIQNFNAQVDYDDTNMINEIQSMHSDMMRMQEAISQMKVTMDTGALVGQIAPQMDNVLGQRASRGRRSR